MKIRPIGNKVLVKMLDEQRKTESGIILPEVHKHDRREAVIVSIGAKAFGECEGCGRKQEQIKVGDKVTFLRMSGEEILCDGEKFRLVLDTEIIGVIE